MSSTATISSKKAAPPAGLTDGAWTEYKSALESLLGELVSRRRETPGGAAPSSDDLRKMVTEAVSAVLLESDFLEKIVRRVVENVFRSADKSTFEELFPKNELKKLCVDAMRTVSMHTLGPLLKAEVKRAVSTSMIDLGNTDEFKSVLDSRFRAMEKYIRSEVVPQTVKQLMR